MARRKICVVTGSRSEYGLLYWLMREIQDDPDLELQIIATGMHLSAEFGLTYRVIEEHGFHINEKVEMLVSSDTPVSITKSIGLGCIGFADTFERLQPDIVVVLGDRFEILAAAQAAMIARIAIAHIHGGEVTEGSIDEAIRHSVTKMAQLHLVATEAFRRRVIQLGEQPDKVFTVGAPGLDNIMRLKLLDRAQLEEALGFSLGGLNFLVTYHPVTLSDREPTEAMQELLSALDECAEAKIIITYPNADTSGRALIDQIHAYRAKRPKHVLIIPSLGQLKYLSLLQYVDVVIGNSSSGLIEVPTFRKPTINIGERQRGRLRAASVIDCAEERSAIKAAIERVLSPAYQAGLEHVVNPYGDGQSVPKITACLKQANLEGITMKKFYDLPVEI